jgi:DNA-binding MarR family transcriptional regulator
VTSRPDSPNAVHDGRHDVLHDADYRRLLEFRTGIRQFLHWSEQQAEAVGVTPAQHQLMLAIRGHAGPESPTIGDVAAALVLRHNSAVGLVDRAVEAGLVVRRVDEHDSRVVRLRLSAVGTRRIQQLSHAHLEELRRLVPRMSSLWSDLDRET